MTRRAAFASPGPALPLTTCIPSRSRRRCGRFSGDFFPAAPEEAGLEAIQISGLGGCFKGGIKTIWEICWNVAVGGKIN